MFTHQLRVPSMALALVVWLTAPCAIAAPNSFTEDFTTTTFCDTLNTTAVWDTTAGELRLSPFAPFLVGSYDTPNFATAVAVDGNFALVADVLSGLQLIDITDRTTPVHVGSYDTPARALDVVIAGDLALVADYTSGLQLVDITDPTAPVHVGSYDTPDRATGVAVAGDLAFVADAESGLLIVDITNTSNPVLVGARNTEYAVDVVVAGDLAYVADSGAGLHVIDITDPTSPVIRGTYDTPGRALGVAVAGDLAFVADDGAGLQVIDITRPITPAYVGTYDTPGQAWDVAVAGGLAYLADKTAGLHQIDITDPTNPILIGTFNTPDIAAGVAIAGDLAFVADGEAGLQVIDIGEPAPPELTGSLWMWAISADVTVSGTLAFVAGKLDLADATHDVHVIDVSDLTSPVPISRFNMNRARPTIEVDGNLAFALDREVELLMIFDITDPTDPVMIGSYHTATDYPWTVRIAGDLALLVSDQVDFLDISDPTNPILLGTYDGRVDDLVVAGDLAFMTLYGMLDVVDISDPTNPFLVARYTDVAGELAIAGNYIFSVTEAWGLDVIDISDPTSPEYVTHVDTPGIASDVQIAGDRAYVADHAAGLHVFDISDPTDPILTYSYDTDANAAALAISGEHVFVVETFNGSDFFAGLTVVKVLQHDLNATHNVGHSLVVDDEAHTIVRARLTSTETPLISWQLSADEGSSWTSISPGGSWTRIAVPGEDLLWRSAHTFLGAWNPTVIQLSLDWLNDLGPIVSIADAPDDQGGWVRLSFTRSGYDFAEEDSIPVAGYQVYRRVDDGAFRARIRDSGPVPAQAGPRRPPMNSFDREMIRTLGGRDFHLGESDAGSGFPPGTWEFLTWVGATQSDTYVGSVATVADSSAAGIAWSTYLVTTHTTTPSIWFASPPDSGYSVDNIAPGVPQNLAFGQPDILEWDPATEEDFAYHSAYGSENEIFDDTATLIGHTVDPTFDVSESPHPYYHITTSDDVDNESDAASIENPAVATPDGIQLPTVFALRAARPNPFRAETSIGIDLPEARDVRMSVYDASGRRVRLLIDERRSAGRHQVAWDGRNGAGQRVAPGIYFVRIEAGRNKASRRLVVIR